MPLDWLVTALTSVASAPVLAVLQHALRTRLTTLSTPTCIQQCECSLAGIDDSVQQSLAGGAPFQHPQQAPDHPILAPLQLCVQGDITGCAHGAAKHWTTPHKPGR